MATTLVKGTLVNLEYREVGDTNWIRVVCTKDSTFTISSEISKTKTNCGLIGAPGAVDFNSTVNAVHNAVPGALEASYNDIKDLIVAGTLVQFRWISSADVSAGLALGDGFNNFGQAYWTNLEATATAEDDGYGQFSATLEGIGILDDFDAS